MSRIASEGAGRHDHAEAPDNPPVSESRLAAALDDVIDTVMLYGQWPQPRPASTYYPLQRRVDFSLIDWLYEETKFDGEELVEFLVLSITDSSTGGPFDDTRNRHEKRVTEMLREHLADSEIVRDRAEQMDRDAAEMKGCDT